MPETLIPIKVRVRLLRWWTDGQDIYGWTDAIDCVVDGRTYWEVEIPILGDWWFPQSELTTAC